MFDVVIIGAGAAGYTAAIYTARYKMSTLIIGAEPGGTTARAYEIENYPGFKKILGRDLIQKIREHVESLNVEIRQEMVTEIKPKDGYFEIESSTSGIIQAKTVIIATGTKHRHLGIPSEKEFEGKGVTYCATCDGFFFKDKTVAIVGGGDSAATAGLFLSQICKQVYLIFRKDELRAEPFWVDELKNTKHVTMIPRSAIVELQGDKTLKAIKLDNGQILEVDGLFVQIGADPETMLADKLNIEKDERGFIKVNAKQETSIPGIFAAGDVSSGSNHFEQIVTSAAEGAIAANTAFFRAKNKGQQS